METLITSMVSGIAIALVVYDIAARLKYQRDMAETLSRLNKTHNELMQSFQALSDQMSRVEMSVGLKSKPVSNAR